MDNRGNFNELNHEINSGFDNLNNNFDNLNSNFDNLSDDLNNLNNSIGLNGCIDNAKRENLEAMFETIYTYGQK